MKEIKITHIHQGKDDESSFIEFIKIDNGKTLLLQWNSFIKRYDEELIKEFRASKVK
ncbi:hypothetical protein [Sulfurimonas sediminis]|uniref:hypothetical protein n=1 Tax=Sulfurimonas sediminis TaxID=2590020 RepID=UPI001865FF2F|nr:hypothetical protein [Sulfurimonas sediminis]